MLPFLCGSFFCIKNIILLVIACLLLFFIFFLFVSYILILRVNSIKGVDVYMYANLNKKITDTIINRMLECEAEGKRFYWVKPFNINGCRYPCNYENFEVPYKGANRLLEPGEYLTFNQINKLNAMNKDNPDMFYHVRKNAHGYPVIYFSKEVAKNKDGSILLDDNNREITKVVARYYYVFNREDVVSGEQNLPSKFPVKRYSHDDIDKLSNQELVRFVSMVCDYAKRNDITIEHITDGCQAYYSPNTNTIRIPMMSNFPDVYSYIHTVSHELGHATGVKLGRFKPNEFASVDKYGKEELCAEITADLIASSFRVIPSEHSDENTLAYLQNWRSVLKENDIRGLLLKSAISAQKAFDEIYNTREIEKLIEEIAVDVDKVSEVPEYVINDIEFAKRIIIANPEVWDMLPDDIRDELESDLTNETGDRVDVVQNAGYEFEIIDDER